MENEKNRFLDKQHGKDYEQEPRLVTKEDFMDADEWGYLPVWCETVEGQVYCECIAVTALYIEQSLYRYWNGKPTEEQRKAVRWEC